jgi:3-hydroxy-9,10-secoandrosta-1,3,5(10)-triene-9,17-dione monooxygenase
LLRRAEEWRPTLIERSAQAEKDRKIPAENIAEFIAKQFLLAGQPPAFGGLRAGLETAAELAIEVGRGCTATSWMTGQWPGHQFLVGLMPLECQQEYWGPSPDTLSSTASAVGRLHAEPERGGLRVTDTMMRFSSGVDYAEWVILTIPQGVALVPKADFRIVDDWFVMGLRGTGSKSLVIEDAWIPPHRVIGHEGFLNCSAPGVEIHPDVPLYRVPVNVTANYLLLSSMVGMAQGLVDIFDERVRTRTDLHIGQKAAHGQGAALRFGESSFEIDLAKRVVRDGFAELIAAGESGTPLSREERARHRRDITQTARVVLNACERLLTAGDASGMYDTNRWQQWGRDVKMAGLQASLTPDEVAISYSRIRWGLDPTSRRI